MGIEDQILAELSEILHNLDTEEAISMEAYDYVVKCFDPNTPSHEILLGEVYRITHRGELSHLIKREDQNRYEKLVEQVEQILIQRGYRYADYYLTSQEHRILDSSAPHVCEDEPYKSVGVTNGKLTVKEAKRARELARYTTASKRWFCMQKDGQLVKVSLEPLDENGNTIRDPQVLDDMLNPVPTQYSDDFPFRREGVGFISPEEPNKISEGLTPKHHRYLNTLVHETKEEKREIYDRLREQYQGNPLALEQIDIYDTESPYGQHMIRARDAFKSGDETVIQREEAWFKANYPLTTKLD